MSLMPKPQSDRLFKKKNKIISFREVYETKQAALPKIENLCIKNSRPKLPLKSLFLVKIKNQSNSLKNENYLENNVDYTKITKAISILIRKNLRKTKVNKENI